VPAHTTVDDDRSYMYDIDWVRETVKRVKEDGRGNIRVHPNGFIQLDLIPVAEDWHASYQKGHSGATLRLHIWNPPDHDLPHQKTVNEIHDHVFDMHSTVIKGVLQQWLYSFVVGTHHAATHELYRAVYDKKSDSRLEASGVRGVLRIEGGLPVTAGNSYSQPAFTLHDSDAQDCVVTVMSKTEVHEGNPVVLCPIGEEPDNSYDRATAAPEDYLWSAVEAAIA
jgi:hypothetical protein